MPGDHRIDAERVEPSRLSGRRRQRHRGVAADAIAALAALVTGLTINYLFVPPRHELGIATVQDAVELGALMLAAGLLSRLAATSRARAEAAEQRAAIAAARERDASLLAEIASAILSDARVASQLEGIGARIARTGGASSARVVVEPVPRPQAGELVQPLLTAERPAWLYVEDDGEFTEAELRRLAPSIARLVDVALVRERVGQQAAAAQAAGQAERLRTAVLHAVSHDLRSPLTAISTATSALRGPISEAERLELIELVSGQTRRLAKLVDDLLDLSRIEAGAVAPRTDWCDLRDVVGSVLSGLDDNAQVHVDLPDSLPLVLADAAQLERVFANLLENAIRHSPDHEAIVIRGASTGARVTVRVIDRGDGIPVSERARVFEPFFRGRRRRGGGSGLGLAITRGFVEANGGEIVVSSDQGRGTSFAVSFPSTERPGVVNAGPAGPASHG